MRSEAAPAHLSHTSAVFREVRIGGMCKARLLAELSRCGVGINETGQLLFADERFGTAGTVSGVGTVELSVSDLGFEEGSTSGPMEARIAALGLSLCPLELGPHLRLQFADQAEGAVGQLVTRHRAPPGSLTIASVPLPGEEVMCRGFYLRRIEGMLWLRGFSSPPEHVWRAEDRLVFQCPLRLR